MGEQFLDAPLNLVALSGAKTIAGWYQDEDFTRGVAEGAFLTAQSSNLNLLGGGPLAVPLNATLADYRIIASKMKDLNPDIVVAGSRVKSCVWFLKACKEIDIGPATVFRWLDECPLFREKYAKARETQAEKFADEIVAIADEAEVTSVVTPDGVVDFKLDATAVARNRLRVDARKWVASKLLPKKYGDKVQQEVTGANGGPIQTAIRVVFD